MSIKPTDRFFSSIWLKIIFGCLLVGLFVVFIYGQRQEIVQIPELVRHSNKLYLLFGLGVVILYHVAQGLALQASFALVGRRLPLIHAISLYLKRYFVGSFLPAGFTLSQFTMTSDLADHKIKKEESHTASLFYLAAGSLSFVFVFVPASLWLLLSNEVTASQTTILLIVVAAFAIVAYEATNFIRGIGFTLRIIQTILPIFADRLEKLRNTGLTLSGLLRVAVWTLLGQLIGIAILFSAIATATNIISLKLAFFCYIIATVFLTISPMFQGIGIVEYALVYSLKHFGIRSDYAVTVTFVYRTFQLWLPVLAGGILVARKRWRSFINFLPIGLALTLGVTNIISAVSRPLANHFDLVQDVFSLRVVLLSRIFLLVSGFLFLILAMNLAKHSRRAWQITFVLTLMSLAIQSLPAHRGVETFLIAAVAITLTITRESYTRDHDWPSFKQGITVLVTSFLGTLAYGVIGFYFLDARHFGTAFTFSQSLVHVLRLYFTFGDPTLIAHTHFAHTFIGSIYGVGIFSILYSFLAFFRPVIHSLRTLPHERLMAHQLVEKYGSSSLDYFKTYWDKELFFSQSGDAFLSYKLARDTAVILGDPVGKDQAAVARCLEEFRVFCRSYMWSLAFYQTDENYQKLYKADKLQAMQIGTEAFISLTEFDLSLARFKEFRNSVSRLERLGYRAEMLTPPNDRQILARLGRVNQKWQQHGNRVERIFSQGIFDEGELKDKPIGVVKNDRGVIVAFVSFVKHPHTNLVSVDLIRRIDGVPNGVMEYLFAVALTYWKDQQVALCSLGLAPLAGLTSTADTSAPERALGFVYDRLNIGFSYQGLHRFKQKFDPTWEVRYLNYEHNFDLPKLGLALFEVSTLEGVTRFFMRILRGGS